MDELRLILLIIGIIIIIGIYGTGRRQVEQKHSKSADTKLRLEPYLSEVANTTDTKNDEQITTPSVTTDMATSAPGLKDKKLKDNELKDKESKEEEQTPQNHAEHASPKAYNIDVERNIQPVSIENWRFKPIESGLKNQHDSAAQTETETQETGASKTNTNHAIPVKDPHEHQRFSHLEDSLLMVINVLANEGTKFGGIPLQEAFYAIGLEYGDMRIYHYYPDDCEQRLFSVASIKEPGCFDFDNPKSFFTKGISLFMLLPGPLDGKLAYETLYGVATDLANKLGGYLCDADFNKLTKQATAHMQDKVSEFCLHQHSS